MNHNNEPQIARLRAPLTAQPHPSWTPENVLKTIRGRTLHSIQRRLGQLAQGRPCFTIGGPVLPVVTWRVVSRGATHVVCELPPTGTVAAPLVGDNEMSNCAGVEVTVNQSTRTANVRQTLQPDGHRRVMVRACMRAGRRVREPVNVWARGCACVCFVCVCFVLSLIHI